MTTKVMIVNFGPNPVDVIVRRKHSDGTFIDVEDETQRVWANASKEMYVHGEQKLRIEEVKT